MPLFPSVSGTPWVGNPLDVAETEGIDLRAYANFSFPVIVRRPPCYAARMAGTGRWLTQRRNEYGPQAKCTRTEVGCDPRARVAAGDYNVGRGAVTRPAPAPGDGRRTARTGGA